MQRLLLCRGAVGKGLGAVCEASLLPLPGKRPGWALGEQENIHRAAQPQACRAARFLMFSTQHNPEHQLSSTSQGRTFIPSGCRKPGPSTTRPGGSRKVWNSFKATLEEQTSHLLKELIHETIPVHADGDFIIIITVLCLQQHREREASRSACCRAHSSISGAPVRHHLLLLCSLVQGAGQTPARAWNTQTLLLQASRTLREQRTNTSSSEGQPKHHSSQA